MNTQDQWFEPGDKVCRVSEAGKLGLSWAVRHSHDTSYGRVLCVEDCWQGCDGLNRLIFVGVPRNPENAVWYACCFRRIEEIQLCVRAAEKFKQNEEVEV